MPTFYALPKIHKSVCPPLGRPIVVGIGSILHLIAQYIIQYLQSCFPKIIFYIWDTKHFMQFTEGRRVPIDAILITLDMRALKHSLGGSKTGG